LLLLCNGRAQPSEGSRPKDGVALLAYARPLPLVSPFYKFFEARHCA
jgi:hypothetical protein